MNENLKVVFDTQIYLRAFVNPRSVCGRLFSDWTAYYILHVTEVIEAEIIGLFNRPKIRAKFPQITSDTLNSVKALLKTAAYVDVEPDDIEVVCRDPKDDMFLACAKAAQADYLVSEDKDLLVLEHHHNTQIVNVAAFLSLLEQRRDSESSSGE